MFAKRFSLVLALALAVYAGAALVLHSWFPRDGKLEAFFCRFYLCDNDLLIERAYQDLWGSEPTAAAASVPEFEESLRRNPASPFRWCDLGDALLRAGEVDRSRYYYEQAVKLGPESPAVLLRAAHFHAQAGEPGSASPLLARILDGTRRYDDVVFSYYDRMGIAVADVLARGMPENPGSAQSYFRHLLRRGEAAELGRAWEWLFSRSLAEGSQLSGYVDFLLRARQYETARRTLTDYVGPREQDAASGNIVFNSGFEFEPTGAALDWRIALSDHAQAARDSSVSQTGSWSLKIRFDGEENLAYRHVTQRVAVTAGGFRFSASVRADGITTDQGVGFHIVDSESRSRLEVHTDSVVGTSDWTTITETFAVPAATRLLEIGVVRRPSLKFDNKIAGTVWIDDVSLVRE